MGKYLFPALFVLFAALNIGAYAFFMLEVNGSTVKTKHTMSQPQIRTR